MEIRNKPAVVFFFFSSKCFRLDKRSQWHSIQNLTRQSFSLDISQATVNTFFFLTVLEKKILAAISTLSPEFSVNALCLPHTVYSWLPWRKWRKEPDIKKDKFICNTDKTEIRSWREKRFTIVLNPFEKLSLSHSLISSWWIFSPFFRLVYSQYFKVCHAVNNASKKRRNDLWKDWNNCFIISFFLSFFLLFSCSHFLFHESNQIVPLQNTKKIFIPFLFLLSFVNGLYVHLLYHTVPCFPYIPTLSLSQPSSTSLWFHPVPFTTGNNFVGLRWLWTLNTLRADLWHLEQ